MIESDIILLAGKYSVIQKLWFLLYNRAKFDMRWTKFIFAVKKLKFSSSNIFNTFMTENFGMVATHTFKLLVGIGLV